MQPPYEGYLTDDDYNGINVHDVVFHQEYGSGRVIGLSPTGVVVWWNTPILGTKDTHILIHDPEWIRQVLSK